MTLTPEPSATPTGQPSPTIGTECTEAFDVCGVCGGQETDFSKCSVPSNCTLVAPTKEMKKIASQLKKATNTISVRFKADKKRVRQNKSCKKLVKSKAEKDVSDLLLKAREDVKGRILRSVLVCDSDCLTVSFADEITGIRNTICKASKKSQSYARKVVACAPRTGGSSAESGPRGEDQLKKAVADTKRIVHECKVCKH